MLLVMHGVNRDADRYRDDWAEVAARQGAVLLCPEFSRADFPTDGQYNFGNVYTEAAEDGPLAPPHPEASWSYSYLDPLFDAVAARLKLRTPGFLLYGHSAGSQFVHRLAFFAAARKQAELLKTPFNWQLVIAPGVGHDDKRIAPFAEKVLFPVPKPSG